jgi:coproporphyrinogen III oxidase
VLIVKQGACHIERDATGKRDLQSDAVQPEAIGGGVLPPPPVHMGIPVVGVPDARVAEVADVPTDLVVAPGARADAKQGTPRLVASPEELDDALRGLEDAVVVLHGVVDSDRRFVLEPPSDKCDVGFHRIVRTERRLQGARPALLLGEEQASGGLAVQSMDRVHPATHLIPHGLKRGIGPGCIDVSVHQQPGRLRHHDPLVGFGEYLQGGTTWQDRLRLRGVTGYGRSMVPDPTAVRRYLEELQNRICDALERADGHARFEEDRSATDHGGISAPRVLTGDVIERAGVNLTHSVGERLPDAASSRRPELAGRAFQAVSLSVIVHPANPYAPTTHANFRYFQATSGDEPPVWWFGGGFDLTPFYGFDEDAIHWHRTARAACAPFGAQVYPELKAACDRYFFLRHRNEPRGIGGIFFDDWRTGGPEQAFAFLCSAGDHFVPAYLPILDRRKAMAHGDRERAFQLLRRGRYVEFNLIQDQGTKYGIQSGRRIDAVMCSMPPMVRWQYGYTPTPGSDEERLYSRYLVPRDWAEEGD